MRRGKTGMVVAASLGLGLALAGCAAKDGPSELDAAQQAALEETALNGEALSQRRTDLMRAWRDLVRLDTTMQALSDRGDSPSIVLLDNFIAEYMAKHLDPLLQPRWQSSHPEVMALDANLRFMKAQLLSNMRYPRRVQDSIDDIEKRFEGRESMLVEYPVGEQRSLGDALELLRDQKWNG
ncbi:MAG: hypothetical protein R3F35_22855 [Myxococcota bacterium]